MGCFVATTTTDVYTIHVGLSSKSRPEQRFLLEDVPELTRTHLGFLTTTIFSSKNCDGSLVAFSK